MFHSVARRVNSSSSVVPDTTSNLRRRHEAAPEEAEDDASRGATHVVDVLENDESAPALGVPGEVLGEVAKYLDSSTLLLLRIVSRSFDEAPHVRAEFVHRTACALMRKEGIEGLQKALVLIASLPSSLRIGPLQALARDACDAGVENDARLERVERILQEVLKVDDGAGKATAIAELACSFASSLSGNSQRVMSVYRKVLSAVSELDPQHPQTAVAVNHVAIATGIVHAPRAVRQDVFKMAVFQILRLPQATQATGLMSVVDLSDSVPDAMVAAAFGDILSAALGLARSSDKLWHVIYRVQDLFERLPDEDFRAAFNAVSALVAACPAVPSTRGVIDKLLREFSRLPDVEVPEALAPLLPSIARNYVDYHFFQLRSVVEIMGRLSPQDKRAVHLTLWKEGRWPHPSVSSM